MTCNELRRRALLCERLAHGAIPYSVAQELLRLADEFEAEALSRLIIESSGRRAAGRTGQSAAA
jgi:hypothetical protein